MKKANIEHVRDVVERFARRLLLKATKNRDESFVESESRVFCLYDTSSNRSLPIENDTKTRLYVVHFLCNMFELFCCICFRTSFDLNFTCTSSDT